MASLDILNSALGGTSGSSALQLAGDGGVLQPIFDGTNTTTTELHNQIVDLGTDLGIPEIAKAIVTAGAAIGVSQIGDAPPSIEMNLVTAGLNAPGQILAGNQDGAVHDIGLGVENAGFFTLGIPDAFLNGGDPSNPIPEIIDGVGGSLQSTPLLTLDGGNTGSNSLLGGVVGDLTQSSSGHLIDVDLGPEQDGGLPIDLLASPGSAPNHAAEINAIDVGPNGPHLLDIGALSSGGILDIPSLSGGGADSLTGNLLGAGGILDGIAPGSQLTGDIASGNTGSVTDLIDVSALTDMAQIGGGDHGLLDLHGTHII